MKFHTKHLAASVVELATKKVLQDDDSNNRRRDNAIVSYPINYSTETQLSCYKLIACNA